MGWHSPHKVNVYCSEPLKISSFCFTSTNVVDSSVKAYCNMNTIRKTNFIVYLLKLWELCEVHHIQAFVRVEALLNSWYCVPSSPKFLNSIQWCACREEFFVPIIIIHLVSFIIFVPL